MVVVKMTPNNTDNSNTCLMKLPLFKSESLASQSRQIAYFG